MRTLLIMAVTALAALTVEGCKEKKNTDNIITKKVVRKAPTKPQSMQPYTQRKDIDWAGSHLTCEIMRTPDDSLPMVKDETGQKHIDNRIRLTIRRTDGSTFFEKSFTKTTFDGQIDDDYRQNGILEGLVFDRIDGGRLLFAASVSHPQTDEYIPLVVAITRNGAVSLSRDTQMDTNGETDDE